MKKWLYGVALGALLLAGKASGITVHEVLSNDFWSVTERMSLEKLESETREQDRIRRPSKWRERTDSEGTWTFYKGVDGGVTRNHTRWKQKRCYNELYTGSSRDMNKNINLTANDGRYKQKQQDSIVQKVNCRSDYDCLVDITSQSTYMNKPLKKNLRPIGAFVIDDWFPDQLQTKSYKECRFFGTEHTAVTNVISDNEAYITGTISQTGHIDEYRGYVVDEDASLLRTYTRHITTDADHVYVEQEITEDSENTPNYNTQKTYQTQYTATFKKGRWKNETETISLVSHQEASSWYIKYSEQNAR